MASKLSLFLAELKRRKVTRVAVAYALVGVGVVEGADIIGSPLGLPEWIIPAFSLLVVVGFPIALVLAWALEVTPQGIQRTPDLTPGELVSHTPGKWRASSWILSGLGLVVVLGAGYYVFFRDSEPDFPEPRLAIIPFQNRTGDAALDDLGSMASDRIAEGVSGSELIGGFYSVIPSQQVRAATSTNLDASSKQEPILALAEATDARIVVSGWYYSEGEALIFQAEITGVDEGRVSASVQERGTRSDQGGAVESISDRVMGVLISHVYIGLGFEPYSQNHAKHSAVVASTAGDRAFGSDYREAIAHFDRAVEIDSTFYWPRLRTVVAYLNLGERAEADSVLNLLEPYRGDLSIMNRLWLDYRRASVRRHLMAKLVISRQMIEVEPENPMYQSNAGGDALGANRPREAIEHLTPLIELPQGGTAQLLGTMTSAHHMLGDHEEELRLARRGREFSPTSFARLQDEVEALAALGRIEEVNQLLDESLTFSAGSPGTLMRITATELLAHGYENEARQVLDRALSWYENRPPNEKSSEGHRRDVARTLYAAERWEEAQPLFRDLNTEAPDSLEYLGYLGLIAAREEDRTEALRIDERFAEMDDPYLGGSNTYWRAGIAAVLGERERAVDLLREAHSEGVAFGISWHRSVVLEPLRGYEPFEELTRPKG